MASKRRTQYFEMVGHRSLYHDGWRSVCLWPGPSFTKEGTFFGKPVPAGTSCTRYRWLFIHSHYMMKMQKNKTPHK